MLEIWLVFLPWGLVLADLIFCVIFALAKITEPDRQMIERANSMKYYIYALSTEVFKSKQDFIDASPDTEYFYVGRTKDLK